MPDHLHLLVEVEPKSNLIRFVKAFKQTTSFRHRTATGLVLWQKGYYDHALRSEEDVPEVATYILNNPVRAGLADTAAAYRFSGGILAGDLKVAPTRSYGSVQAAVRSRRSQ
jgi:REP element-mobilizing transposase RayT